MKKLSFLMAVLLCMAVLVPVLPAAAERSGLSFKVETTNGLEHPTGYYYSPKQLEQIPVTFEAWVYIPSERYSGKNAVISNYLEIPGDEFFDFCIYANGVPTLFVGRGLGKDYATFNFSDAKVPADTWTHVAVVYGTGTEGKQAFCYINGVLKHQSAVEDYVPMTEGVFENTVCLGGDLRSFNQQWFKGELGEVRMYADVRSQAEIAADMTTAADRNDQDLIMYYELSAELSGKDVEDKGPKGYDMLYGEMWLVEQEMEQLRALDTNEYTYSIAVLPDPQFSTQDYPYSLKSTFDYLLDNAEAKNIQYVLGVGDMTNSNKEAQWENIKAQTERLNGKLPYTAIRGNHDVYYNKSVEFFDQYYADPSGYYYQHVQQNGGFYDTASVKNTYLLFEVGSVKYLLLNLDFGANDSVLAWADGILSQYADRRVIATTHAYMDADGTTLDDYDSGSPSTNANKGDLGWNSGEDMWNELFKKHANVQMVICGHIQQDDIILRTRKGDKGNTVYQLLIDTQTSDDKIKGGGFVAMLYFTEDGNNVRVECYSTVQQKYFRSMSNTISFTVGSDYVPQSLPELQPIKEASLTYGNETTYYASLQEAIDAANAGNGGKITLLSDVDWGSSGTVTFAHDTTIDGQGRYKIKATVSDEFFYPAAGVTLTLKDLDLIVTSTTAKQYYSAVYVNTSDARVIIEGCTVQSTNDTAIKAASKATNGSIQISGSNVIGNYLGIYLTKSPCDLQITNSNVVDKLSAIYISVECTCDVSITNSTLTSGYNGSKKYGALDIRGEANVTLSGGTVGGGTAALFEELGLDAASYTGVSYGVQIIKSGAKLTLTGDVTMKGADADLHWTDGNVDFAAYAGPSIVVTDTANETYDFYGTLTEALTATGNSLDNVFTYMKATADLIKTQGYVTQTATDANSTTYYKVVGLDTSLIDNAIADATEKLNGAVVADKPCAVEVGAKYVLSQDTIDDLNAAITAAQAAKTSVATGKDVLDAVQKLIDALEAFEEAVQIGKEHKDEGKDHLCDYGCGKNDMGGACADGDDNNHACDYCQGPVEGEECHDSNTDGKCDECGLDIAHECKDEGKDHACDLCGKRMGGDCADSDTDNDHVCDYCGVTKLNDCTPNADDGDCTTAITCSVCNAVTTAAETAHTGGSATCTAKAVCSTCGKAYGELAQHTYDGDTDASCNVCGAERTVNSNTNNNENNTNTNDNNANTNENNAASKGEAPEKQGLSGGAVAGIVIAVVVVLGGGFALFWFVIKKKKA